MSALFVFLYSSSSASSCPASLTRILRLLRLPFPLNPHGGDPITITVNIIMVMIIIDHHQQNIKQRYFVGADRPFSFLPCGGVLHINSYHILLSFHFFTFFCMYMSIFLFLYTDILRVQISLLLSCYIFFHLCVIFPLQMIHDLFPSRLPRGGL